MSAQEGKRKHRSHMACGQIVQLSLPFYIEYTPLGGKFQP
jgi:hypothetical protein